MGLKKFFKSLVMLAIVSGLCLPTYQYAAAETTSELCTTLGQVVKINGKSYTCLGVLKEGAVPTPSSTASPTSKPVTPKPIPSAAAACTKVGEMRTAPNIIYRCGVSGKKLVWQRLSVESQKIPEDQLYKAPPPLKTQATLVVTAGVKSSTVGIPISLQVKGGAGAGAVSFIPSGVGCYVLGNNLFAANAGLCGVIAQKESDGIYNVSYSSYVSFNFTGQAASGLIIANTNLNNAVSTPVNLITTGGNGNPVIKFATSSPNCKIANNVLTASQITTCYVVAIQNQFAAYALVTSATIGFTFASDQSVFRITTPQSTTKIGSIISLATQGGSGDGAVSYQINNAKCLLAGNTLTATTPTSCAVVAKKASDGKFNEAFSNYVVFNFTQLDPVAQAPLIVSISSKTLDVGQSATVSIKGGNGSGLVTYTVSGAGCSLKGTVVTASAATSCAVYAKKAGDKEYLVAVSNYVVVTFLKVATFSIANTVTTGVINSRILLSTIANTGGVVSYSVQSGNCSLIGSYLTSTSVTSCSVVALLKSNTANVKTITSPPVTFSFILTKGPLAISNTSLVNAVGATIELTSSGGNGNPVSYAITSTNQGTCQLSDNRLKATSPTSCSIYALQKATTEASNILSSPVLFRFAYPTAKISQKSLILESSTVTSVAFKSIPLVARGGSTTADISFTVTGNNCSIVGNSVVASEASTCAVIASREGDSTYNKVYAQYVLFTFNYATQPDFTIKNDSSALNAGETVTVTTQGGAGKGSVVLKETTGNSNCRIDQAASTVSSSVATTCRIIAEKSSDKAYLPATSQSVVFTFNFRRP